MEFDTFNKVAIVTGGAKGIGFWIVKYFLKSGVKGVTVADIDENTAKAAIRELQVEFGEDKLLFVKTDISNKKEFEEAFKKTIEHFHHVDILVNNAGVIDDRCLDRETNINYKGTAYGTLLALKTYLSKYKSGNEGIIINISSVCAIEVDVFLPSYSATKCATLGLSMALGRDLYYKRYGVKVICICIGETITSMYEGISEETMIKHEKIILERANKISFQEADVAGKAVVKITQEGTNGSVWIAENNVIYQIKFPGRDKLRYKL